MYLKFFKFIPFLWLFLALVIPQQAFAQSDMEEIMKRIEQDNYTPTSVQEKEMISEYLESINKPNNISKERILSPDATFFFEENFSAPSLLLDNFDFTGLLSDNGWSAHSGAGLNQISTTTGLTYSGYEGSGIGNAAFIGAFSTSAEDVNRGFTEQNVDGDVVYYSFLVNVTDTAANKTGTYFTHLGDRVSSTSFFSFAARVFAKIETNNVYFGLSNTSTATYGTTAFAKNTTYLLIVKYTISTAGADEAKLWVVTTGVPADEVAAGTPEVTNTTTTGQNVIDAVGLRQSGSSQAELVVDGVRIGKTWTEIFQAPALPTGWTNVDNGVTGQIWEFNNPGGRSITGNFDTDFAILDSDNYGSGGNQNATLTTVAVNCAVASSVTLGFDQSFRSFSGSYGLLEVSNDGSTWIQLDSITVSTGYPNPAVYSEYDITAIAAGQSTVYARWTYVGSWGYWWAIDNITMYEPDPIPLPAVVVSPLDAATGVSANATLNWTAGGGSVPTGYIINFGTDNPPTNIENNTDLGLVTTYDPASLAYSTTYYWEIIPYNGAGNATGTVVWSFTTMADPTITSFPWLEDFEGLATFPPDNWMRYGGLLADPTVLVTSSEWFYDDWLNIIVGSDNSARCNIYGTTRDGWLMTPPIDLGTGTNYQLEFDLALTDFANSNPPENESGIDDKFAVVISTDGGTTWSSTNTLKLWDSTSTGGNYYYDISYTGQHEIIDLTGYSGVIMLGFYGESTVSNGDNDLFIDNVFIQEVPSTPIFSVTPASKDYGDQQIGESSADQTFTISNIGVGTLTITSGNISLTGTDASEFVLTDNNTYPINLTTGQTATVDVNFSPATVGAKTADLQIVDNTADATHLVALTGTGVDATVTTYPYLEAFENGGSIPAGWTQDPTNLEDWFFGLTITYAAGSDHTTGTGYMALIDDSSPYNATPATLISPPFDITGLTAPALSFFYWIGAGNAGPSYISVDVFNGSVWTDSVVTAAVENNQWDEIVIDLTPYQSSGTKVRFNGFENTAGFNCDLSLDDVSVFDNLTPPNCAINPSPADLATDVFAGTNLGWASGGGGPTGYKIYFGTDNPPTNIENGTDLGDVLTYDPASDLSYATVYYWTIVPYNVNGDATGCAVWSFTTEDDPTIVTFPWNDDLETPGAPGTPEDWVQDTGDDFNWTFDAGGTPSSTTGPSVDHNPGTSLGTYGFTESSANYGATANIWTPPFDVSALTNPVFSFWYHMYGASMGTLSVDYSTDNGTTWTNGWTLSGDQGNVWYNAYIALPSDANLIRFSGLTGSSFYSDMAFDDVSIFDNLTPPDCAVNVAPPDAEDSVFVGTDLVWGPGTGITDGYKLYFGTDNPPTNLVNGTDLGNVISYDHPTDLMYSTTYYWQVIAYNVNGDATGCSVWSFTTQDDPTVSTFPFVETFEDDSPTRFTWIQIQEAGAGLWTYAVGSNGTITTAYEDSLNARFVSQSGTNSPITKLVTPPLDLTSVLAPTVTFAYGQPNWVGDQNELKVYYRISSLDPWVEIAHYTEDVPVWTVTSLFLPNASATYQIAFEGINNYGYANVLDSVTVEQGPADDVATISIDIDANIVPGSFAPMATVQNWGSNTNTFDVTMEVNGYTSTKTVTGLASGATEQVTFDNWDPALGSYTAKVYTMLGTDTNASNDTLWKNIVVTPGLFTSGSPYPDGTYLGSGVGVSGYLYSIGGNTNSGLLTECYKYEVATDTWTAIASLPAGRRVLGTAAVGNFIYAIAGSDAASVYQSTVYKYDIGLDTWTAVASMPIALGWVKAVGYNDKVYVAGGVDGASVVQSTVYVYDTVLDTWTAATSMPGPKFGGAFSVTGNMLVYAAGANATVISSDVYVGTIDAIDPAVIVWTTATDYPGLNEGQLSAYVGNLTELMVNPERVKNENPQEVAYPPGAMYRFDAAPWGTDKIIVSNGSPAAAWVPADPCPTYTYDPVADTWEVQANLPIAVLGASLGTVNSGSTWKLVVASGYTGSVVTDATQIYTADIGGGTTFAFTVSVGDAWNMVSVPGTNPAGMGVTDWWSGKDPAADVFKYSGGYVAVTTTAPTEGYWMKNSGAQVYNYTDIQIVAHNPITAAAGWNLIGGYELNVLTANITTNPAGLQDGSVFEYSGGYNVATNLVPGYGYWIKLSGAGQILIPEVLAKGTEPVEFFKEDWGKIILTDATGINYTLYAVKGEVDLNKYELPPAPPTGMFDIRFSSGRIAEDINSSIQTIDMSGVTYPLTVSVEGMDMRLMDETGKTVNVNLKSGEDVVIGDATIQKLMVTGELIPAVYALEQNYPNPFNPSTTIEFSLPEDVSNVKLSIYNALGERVAEIVNTSLVAGKYQYQWNAKNVATGMYIYELRTDKFVSVKKMLLLK